MRSIPLPWRSRRCASMAAGAGAVLFLSVDCGLAADWRQSRYVAVCGFGVVAMDVLDEVMTVRGARARLPGPHALGLLALAAVMLAASLWLAFHSAPGTIYQFVGWFGALFAGAIAAAVVWRRLKTDEVVLRLDAAGLLDRRLSRLPIPWGAIETVGTWQAGEWQVLVLRVPPETETAIDLTVAARATRSSSAEMGADGLWVDMTGLEISHDRLLQAIIARGEAARRNQ